MIFSKPSKKCLPDPSCGPLVSAIEIFYSPYSILQRMPYSIFLCRLIIPICKSPDPKINIFPHVRILPTIQHVYTQTAPLQPAYIKICASKWKLISGFHVTIGDLWSLAFHILETFWLDPSVPFEGYKWANSKLWKRRNNSTLRAKLLWRNYSLHIESASLCHLILNIVFIPQNLPLLIWNFIVSLLWPFLWWRIEVVEAQLEGTQFLGSKLCRHKSL
jgi:hypothetical protein